MNDQRSKRAEFERFCATFQPHIRPEGTLERLHRAFDVDLVFRDSFRLVRPYLRTPEIDWAGELEWRVLRAKSPSSALCEQNDALFRDLYRKHARQFYRGRFDAAYLTSVERVALSMVHLDIKTVWLAGAHQHLLEKITHHVFETTSRHRPKRIEQVVLLLSKAFAIEMNQIQRVYTLVAERRATTF